MRNLNVFVLLTFALILGCDSDPFRFDHKRLVGSYYLDRFSESQKYYLRKEDDDTVSGILEGYITRIGWNDHIIIAHRVPSYEGDREGWFVIDAKTSKIEGPLEEREAMRRAGAKGIIPREVEKAFNLP